MPLDILTLVPVHLSLLLLLRLLFLHNVVFCIISARLSEQMHLNFVDNRVCISCYLSLDLVELGGQLRIERFLRKSLLPRLHAKLLLLLFFFLL